MYIFISLLRLRKYVLSVYPHSPCHTTARQHYAHNGRIVGAHAVSTLLVSLRPYVCILNDDNDDDVVGGVHSTSCALSETSRRIENVSTNEISAYPRRVPYSPHTRARSPHIHNSIYMCVNIVANACTRIHIRYGSEFAHVVCNQTVMSLCCHSKRIPYSDFVHIKSFCCVFRYFSFPI